MTQFLRLKTWILFLILFIPIVSDLTIFYLITYLTWLIWIYLTVTKGQVIIGKELNLKIANLKVFKIYFFSLAFLILLQIVLNLTNSNRHSFSFKLTDIFLFAVSFYMVYSLGYILYIASMTITKLELKHEVDFWNDSISHFIRILFLPVGILGVHPIIRKAIIDYDKSYAQHEHLR